MERDLHARRPLPDDAIEDERVRAPDGIHLNDTGAEMAAGEVLAAIRRDFGR